MIDGHVHLENGDLSVDYAMQFVDAAVKKGIRTLQILDHTHRFLEFAPMYAGVRSASTLQADWLKKKTKDHLSTYHHLIETMKQMDLPIEVRFGLEVCYTPEAEPFLRDILSQYPYDFLVGSVHSVDGILYDMPFSRELLWDRYPADGIYRRYYELIEQLMLHLNEVGAAIRGSAYPLYLMGRMGAGDYLAVVLVLAVMAALCALTYLLLSRTFLSIATANNGGAKAVYKETTVRAAGVPAALLRKELGRFTASPNYMLNCGLGTVMLPILGVLLLVKSSDLLPVIYEMAGGEASGLLATMLCAALCLVGSMNDMASSSISLEGKNLWLAQSLPVTPWQVLRAKLLVQVLVTGISMAVTSVLILLAVRPALPLALLLIALPQAFVWLSAAFGLTMDLKRPNLVWTNEITVIKQRLTVLLAMLGGWVYAALVGVLYYPFGIDMGAAWYLLAWTVLTVVLTLVLLRWLRRTGGCLFAAL